MQKYKPGDMIQYILNTSIYYHIASYHDDISSYKILCSYIVAVVYWSESDIDQRCNNKYYNFFPAKAKSSNEQNIVKIEIKKCNCDIFVVMNQGCRCGGI